MSSKKKRPEFELPPVLVASVQNYYSQAAINRLSSEQAADIMEACLAAANVIGAIVEASESQKLIEHKPEQRLEREDDGQ